MLILCLCLFIHWLFFFDSEVTGHDGLWEVRLIALLMAWRLHRLVKIGCRQCEGGRW
jgi:hypothetical protein